MSDYLSGFDDWTAAFSDWTDVSISELHGIMTALVCAIKPPNIDEWQQLLTELGFTLPSDKAIELLAEYGEDVSFALKDRDDAYEYTPLVPDDEHDLYERLIALKQWAGGFITGIGMADIHLKADELQMLTDLSKIASLRFDSDELDEMDEQEGEETYFNLYEFARLVPVSFSVRQKKSTADLALIKGLDPSRKTANELAKQNHANHTNKPNDKPLPPVVDVMNHFKH